MGGVAGVGTYQNHRFKGYSSLVMENMLRWMRQQGFDVSMLYGITGFYPKFGYVKAFPETYFEFTVRDAERLIPSGYSFVDYRPKYLNATLKMFRRNQAARTGPTERDPRYWKPFRKGVTWGPKAVCRVAVDKHGKPAGYFVYDDALDGVCVLEVGHARSDVFPDIIRAVARMAWKRRLESFRFRLPEDDEVMRFGMHLGCKKEVLYHTDGGPMVRLVNSYSALQKAANLLASRLSGTGRMCIHTNIDRVCLSWSGGELTVGQSSTGAFRCGAHATVGADQSALPAILQLRPWPQRDAQDLGNRRGYPERHVSRDTTLPFSRRCVLTMSCGLALPESQVPRVWRARSARVVRALTA